MPPSLPAMLASANRPLQPVLCWQSPLLGQSSSVEVRRDGPFWVRQRNYAVTALLAAPSASIARETVLSAAEGGNDGDVDDEQGHPQWQLLASECVWGALSLELLLGGAKPRRATAVAEHTLLRGPWVTAMRSGWPVFRLLELLLPEEPAVRPVPFDLLDRCVRELDVLGAWAHRISIMRNGKQAPGPMQPGAALGAVDATAALVLSRVQRLARTVLPAARERSLWAALARLQEALYLRGGCPVGSFVATVLEASSHWRIESGIWYRLCVRQPEAATGPLGASLVDKRIMNHGIWPDCGEVAQFLPDRPGCIALDVGANIGACTLLLSRLGVRVVAVEAEPSNLSMLRAALRLPQPDGATAFANVSIAPLAADEEAGTTSIVRDPTNAGNSAIGQRHTDDVQERESRDPWVSLVPTARLDDIAEEHTAYLGGHLGDVCLVKVDVEAAELRVLRGAPRLLASRGLRVVNFEFVPLGRDGGGGLGIRGALELLSLISAHGFRVRGHRPVLQEREYAPSEFDGLVARLAAVGKLGTTLTALRAR
eukprot:gnl/TRDRNA2_/TRDRNA2_94102_c0_seq1.p1 gnl/TRDRNA2_/TRDRNA2_94102_c0~~gnl/TRDRNA2_/TRDRNA2_94102_c0_seq1.p1  ORF type:complete len:541 (-),score=71.86 gnl/TRDRNA2_/TRDRNA2_94102_c0_seq1:59-1681(-)